MEGYSSASNNKMRSFMKTIFKGTITLLMFATVLFGCEQENYEPNLTAAPGGGTVTEFKAYTLASTTGDNIYGRIVFYKYSSSVTLVQIGLYNTSPASTYSAAIYGGKLSGGATAPIVTLYNVDGTTGAFGTSKFFTIATSNFYDNLDTYNANVKVVLSSTTVTEGDIGANADPVAEGD